MTPPSLLGGSFELVQKTDTLTSEQLSELITKDGRLNRIVSIEKSGDPVKRKPILVSDRVYEGYKRTCPSDNSIRNGWWYEDTKYIRNIDFKILGADLTWTI